MHEIISKELQLTLKRSYQEAKRRRHEFVTLEHLLYALSFDSIACEVLLHAGADVKSLSQRLKRFIDEDLKEIVLPEAAEPQYSLGCQQVLQLAIHHVQYSKQQEEVHGGNVLAALFRQEESYAVYFMREHGISRLDVLRYIEHGISQIEPDLQSGTHREADSKRQGTKASGRTLLRDPLALFCTNLNEKAKKQNIDPLIGRTKELERSLHILARRRKNNPVFVGDAGVGKTALVEGLAYKFAFGDVPPALAEREILSLDMAAILAGTRYRGEFEERLKAIIEAVRKRPELILFIDEIHTIVGAGAVSSGAMDASNIFKPSLANGELSCIGTTTYKEYRQIFEKDHALSRRFQKVEIHEPSSEESISILQGIQKHYEAYHGVRYSPGAIKAAVDLSVRYLTDRCLPDKAIDILDETGAKVKLRAGKGAVQEKEQQALEEAAPLKVSAKDVEDMLAAIAHIPKPRLRKNDKEQLQNLAENLKKYIYGQEHAIDQLVQAIQLSRSGLGDGRKPVGSFLFAGPTGVGKTELSRQLAAQLDIHFLRFDMSEYMEKHTLSRLIGSPPGYVGYDQGGQLTEAIHRQPHCVLLLDEIEKAHEDIFHILLQVMDYATLTDNNGRKSDFRNVILIMTSNTGAWDAMQNAIGFESDVHLGRSLKAVEKTFSPEFRNRLNAIIEFHKLDIEQVKLIVSRMLEDLALRLKSKDILLEADESALLYLAQKGFDPRFGARPVLRLIESEISHKLSKAILFGPLAKGGKVRIHVHKSKLLLDF